MQELHYVCHGVYNACSQWSNVQECALVVYHWYSFLSAFFYSQLPLPPQFSGLVLIFVNLNYCYEDGIVKQSTMKL